MARCDGGGIAIADLIVTMLLLLAASRALGEVFERFRQSAIVGEVLAGILLGPYVLRLAAESASSIPEALVRSLEGKGLAVDRINSEHYGNRILLLAAASTAEVNALRRRVSKSAGVARAVPLMFVGVNEKEAWIDEGIEEHLQAARR